MTTSMKKLRLSDESDKAKERAQSTELHNGYRLVTWSFLQDLCNGIICKECKGSVSIEEHDVRGLGFKLKIICSACESESLLKSCPMIGDRGNAYMKSTVGQY